MVNADKNLRDNIKLYRWYQASANFLPWLPVFFLFFNQYVSLSEALVISSAYYLAVFALEVPSGYLSDRFGRRPTLLIASLSAVIAYGLFLVSDGLLQLVLAQCFLAGFFALKSGSDTSLLYDSLQQLGRQDEYATEEAEAEKIALLALAAGGLAGGICGFFSLHLAYALSLVSAVISFALCWQFSEPERAQQARAFIPQLILCFGYLKKPLLLWVFGFFVLTYSLAHIPAEFNQPYIKLLEASWFGDLQASALVSGVLITLSMLLGAFGAAISMRMQQWLGVYQLLVLGLVIQTVIIGAMAWLLHPLILCLVMFRNFPMAFTHAPMMSAIAPQIDSAQRATYLSIQSLAGRLVFAVLLFGLSGVADDSLSQSGIDRPNLSWLLRLSVGLAVVGTVIIYLGSRTLRDRQAASH